MKLIQSLKGIKGAGTIRNEKGYTLLIVLVIITLTVIFALGLTGMAMNTSVQVNKTERYNKATDLAEMGITYYKTKINSLVTGAFNGKTILKQSELDLLMAGLKTNIEDIKNSDSAQKVAGDDFAYEIKDLSVDISQNHKLAIAFKTIGKANEDKRELTTRLNYTINEGNLFGVYKIPDPGKFPSSSTDCHYGNNKISYMQCFYKPGQSVPSVKIEYSTLKIIGNEDFDHFSNASSSNIYVEGDILLSKANNITNLKIHITGNLNKNAESPDFKNFDGHTLLEVEGNASVGVINNTKNNFELIVGKNLTVDKLTSNNTGKLIVYGDATINNIELTPNMNVCVFGKYSGHDPKPSFINVYGEPNFLKNEVCGKYAADVTPFTLNATPEESVNYH